MNSDESLDNLNVPEALDLAAERLSEARRLVHPTDSPRDIQKRGEWDTVLSDLSLATKLEKDGEDIPAAAEIANRAHRSIEGYAEFYRQHSRAHLALRDAAEAAAYAAGLLVDRSRAGE